MLPGRVEEGPGRAVARERVLLVGVPQALRDPDELQAAGVAGVVVEVLVAAEVRRRAGVAAGDDVPAGPSAGDEVQRRQAAGEVERVVVGRGHGGDQAQVPGGHRQGRQQRHRLEPVEVVRRGVGGDELAVDDEDQVELGRLGQPGLLDVPVDVDAGVAGDLRVEPEVVLAGAARAHGDGAELELPLPRGHARTACSAGGVGVPRLVRVPPGDLLADQRQQLAAVVDGVVVRVVAPDQDRGDADVEVVEDRLGDRLGRADERGRVACGAGGGGERGPQRPVVQLALLGRGEQPLRADVGRLLAAQPPGLAAAAGSEVGHVLLGRLQDAVGALPGQLLGRAEDGTEAHADAGGVGAARRLGGGVDRVDLLLRLRQGLAPEGEGVGVLAADPVGGSRGAAEVQPDPRTLGGADLGVEVLDLVVPALVGERLLGGPGLLEDVQVLVGAVVALVLGQVVAVAALLGVAAAGDDVHRDPAAGELVEGGERPRGQGRRDEPRSVRDQEAEPLGVRGGVGGDLGAVGPGGAVADEHPVEPGVLVRPGEAPDVVGVDDRACRQPDLRFVLGADHSDELDGHVPPPSPRCFHADRQSHRSVRYRGCDFRFSGGIHPRPGPWCSGSRESGGRGCRAGWWPRIRCGRGPGPGGSGRRPRGSAATGSDGR